MGNLNFNQKASPLNKLGIFIGYILGFIIFSVILFFILTYFNKIPKNWTFLNIVNISLTIFLSGKFIQLILK
ncbi:hypothetical protein CMI46_00415 [Candidatus Pacearchaeota archaeon]|nr:hypothetical protein [Candidatus Pacearchaeota archaeon]|tara:strand:- start:21822 stop:22037 length:216 start_codon:yes stop_codon:yes gene_type:complete